MITFQPFRDIVKERKISTYYLRNKCGYFNINPSTLARLMVDQPVSTNTINSLCNILQCNCTDIMEFTPDEETKL